MPSVRCQDGARLLVIATGGTIGAAPGAAGALDAAPEADAFLRGALARSREGAPRFELRFARVGPWLSENVKPRDWTTLATAVVEALEGGEPPDGVVIAHGTDTLAWTASALSFLIEAPPVPLVLTGALLPADRPGSDAGANLRDAVAWAANLECTGCYVVFRGPAGTGEIFRGNRLVSMGPYARHFTGGEGAPLGEVREGVPRLSPAARDALPARPPRGARATLRPALDDGVGLVAVHPGLRPEDLVRLAGVEGNAGPPAHRALVLDLYHSGTASTRDGAEGGRSLVPAIRRCVERGVLVFGLPSHHAHAGEVRYATTRALLDAGLRPLPAMTREAACTKLMWLLGQNPGEPEAVATAMSRDLRGEVFVPTP